MKRFYNNLSGRTQPVAPAIDGGELIALVPDVPDGEPGRGYTNTGIHYCKEESEARTDGKMIFWSSNWGRKDNATAGGRFQGIAKIAIDYAATDGLTVPPTYTAELLDHMETHSLYTTSSVQGIMQRGNGGTVYISDSGVRGYQPQSDINGTAVPDGSILQGGPALAYDPTDDTYLRGSGEVIERWSFSPNVLVETLAIDLTGFTIDHISLNTDEDILMVTGGGRTLRYYKYSTLELLATQAYEYPATTIDIEGCALVKSHHDNKYYVFISSDNWFHSNGDPDTDVNAIWKLEPSITLPLP